MTWIKCSERMPPEHSDVLSVWLTQGVKILMVCRYTCGSDDNTLSFYEPLDMTPIQPLLGEITHWQPLPQPPGEGE